MQFPNLSTPDFGSLSTLDPAHHELETEAQYEEAAQKFESLFATLLVKEMRRSLPDGLFGDGGAADIYAGWFDQHIGAELASDGALDIAGMVKVGLHTKAAAAEGEA